MAEKIRVPLVRREGEPEEESGAPEGSHGPLTGREPFAPRDVLAMILGAWLVVMGLSVLREAFRLHDAFDLILGGFLACGGVGWWRRGIRGGR